MSAGCTVPSWKSFQEHVSPKDLGRTDAKLLRSETDGLEVYCDCLQEKAREVGLSRHIRVMLASLIEQCGGGNKGCRTEDCQKEVINLTSKLDWLIRSRGWR